tara:strand:+ start:1137 stop:1361 length:225 start_codon:yes stop_codon:yes gene_type:complete
MTKIRQKRNTNTAIPDTRQIEEEFKELTSLRINKFESNVETYDLHKIMQNEETIREAAATLKSLSPKSRICTED